MSYRVWGDAYSTAEITNGTKTQQAKMNKNVILRYVRTWIVCYNDPTFTSLTMNIYASNGGTQGKLLHTSTNSLTKSEIITLSNGVKDIYFEFDDIVLNGSTQYFFALRGTGAAFSDTSFIAWKKAFPEPVYPTGWTPSMTTINSNPFDITFIGADL